MINSVLFPRLGGALMLCARRPPSRCREPHHNKLLGYARDGAPIWAPRVRVAATLQACHTRCQDLPKVHTHPNRC